MADRYFMCELAEALGMTLQDLGNRASNHEVCVIWPAYFAEKARRQQIMRDRAEAEEERNKGRLR